MQKLGSAKLRTLRALGPYPSLIRAYARNVPARLLISPIGSLRAFFVLCCVVSIVRYGFRLKNPRKATGPDFIPLKVIKFASNDIDSQLYNIIIKDLEKKKYLEEPKTA